jgi:hypothetical protein
LPHLYASAGEANAGHDLVQVLGVLPRLREDDGLAQLLAVGEDHVLEHSVLVQLRLAAAQQEQPQQGPGCDHWPAAQMVPCLQ